MTHPRDWLDILTAAAPVLAVVVAVIVGWVQMRIQKRQADQDLFEKRFVVYSGTRDILNALIDLEEQELNPSTDFLEDFAEGVAHAEFLFGDDVTAFLDNVYLWGCRRLARLAETAPGRYSVFGDYSWSLVAVTNNGTEVERIAFSRSPLIELTVIKPKLNAVFQRYLVLHHDLPWTERAMNYVDERLKAIEERRSRTD